MNYQQWFEHTDRQPVDAPESCATCGSRFFVGGVVVYGADRVAIYCSEECADASCGCEEV